MQLIYVEAVKLPSKVHEIGPNARSEKLLSRMLWKGKAWAISCFDAYSKPETLHFKGLLVFTHGKTDLSKLTELPISFGPISSQIISVSLIRFVQTGFAEIWSLIFANFSRRFSSSHFLSLYLSWSLGCLKYGISVFLEVKMSLKVFPELQKI